LCGHGSIEREETDTALEDIVLVISTTSPKIRIGTEIFASVSVSVCMSMSACFSVSGGLEYLGYNIEKRHLPAVRDEVLIAKCRCKRTCLKQYLPGSDRTICT